MFQERPGTGPMTASTGTRGKGGGGLDGGGGRDWVTGQWSARQYILQLYGRQSGAAAAHCRAPAEEGNSGESGRRQDESRSAPVG